MATHDTILTLMGDKRLVIKNGGIAKIVETTKNEKINLTYLTELDSQLLRLRDRLRNDETIDFDAKEYFKNQEDLR